MPSDTMPSDPAQPSQIKFQAKLDASIATWNLLESKFYQAWSSGTLPVEALQSYAREYGAFIALLPQAWEVQHDEETAEEEREHIELWENFAHALGARIGEAEIFEVRGLMTTAKTLFADRITALGALYAFEAQQPATAKSKLDGLRQHYKLSHSAEPYFEVHSRNHHEAEKIVERIAALSFADQERAIDACLEMSQALVVALDGIYAAEMPSSAACNS